MKLNAFKELNPEHHEFKKLSVPLQALLIDYNNDWDKAHTLVQDDPTAEGAWVHAYLHRKEGDNANARYWYSIAGQRFSYSSLEMEWEEIASVLLLN